MNLFLGFGVLLTSVFTLNISNSSDNQSYISSSVVDGGASQIITWHSNQTLTSLLGSTIYRNDDNKIGENEYESELFNLDLNYLDTIYKDYINCSVHFYYDSSTSSVYDVSLSLEYMDYDYQFPYLNFLCRAYYNFPYDHTSQSVDFYFVENDFHALWIGETWSNTDVTLLTGPMNIYIEFIWLPPQVAGDSVIGAYPGADSVYDDYYELGYKNGQSYGEQIGYDNGYSIGKSEGEQIGYSNGYADALDQGATASIIFNGIISVGLLPVNVFLRMLNFEVFGINIGAFVSSLLTICIIIIIMRMFLGGKSGSE